MDFNNVNSFATQTMASSRRGCLSSLPSELLVSVFCHLPSFKEAFVLSSTCHQMQDIWLNNVATIYEHLRRLNIPCERHARKVLALQGGPPAESRITSARDVIQMMRNRNEVERATRTFECQIHYRIVFRNSHARERCDLAPLQHPPHLTALNDHGSPAPTTSFGF